MTMRSVGANPYQRFTSYLETLNGDFVKLAKLDFLNPDGTVAFSLDNNPKPAPAQPTEARTIHQTGYVRGKSDTIAAVNAPQDAAVMKLKTKFTPNQDLHGYDGPWAAGAGKNLIPMTLQQIKDANTSGTWAGNVYTRNGVDFTINTNEVGDVTTIAVNGTATSDSYLLLFRGTINLPAGDYASLISDSAVNVSMQLRIGSSAGSDVMGGATTTNRTTTVSESTNIIGRLRVINGNTVDNMTVYPMLSQQSAALSVKDYEPYANVCPIVGFPSITAAATGINIWDEQWEVGIYDSDGTKLDRNDAIRSKDKIPVVPGETYYFHFADRYVTGIIIRTYDSEQNFIATYLPKSAGLSYTIPENVRYIAWCSYIADNLTTYANDVSFNYPATDTSYHAYSGTSVTVNLNGNRYGGTYDFISGTLTLDRVMQFDTWGNLTTSGTFTNTIRKRMDLSILADGTNDARALSISNITTYVNGTADYVHYQIGQNGNLVSFYLPPDTPDSTEIQICYYVAVPIVVQLTAGSMTILAGAKNVYSAGPIEVEAKYMTVVKEQEKLPETIRSSAFLQSGTISCNLQNGRRRQAQVTLVNLDNAYEFAVNHIWFGQQLRLSEGLILPDGTEYYIPQGIFEIETPQESLRPGQKTVTYSLVDKWANLDGTLFGNLEDVYSVAQGTNILSAIASVLLLDRFDMSNSGTHPIDPAKPILTNYYNDKTQTLTDGTVVSLIEAPYDFNSGSTGTAAEVILGLTEMVAGDVGYNQVGRLVLNPSQDDILDTDKPILWEFTQDSKTFLGVDYTTKAGDVYNDVIVVGATSDTNATARGRAQNLDPTSDTCVSRIGRKTIRLEMSNYYSDDICQDYAAWQLKRYSTVSKEVTVTCSQMFHIVENELITVQRSDKPGSPIERHVVQGFSRPIAQTGNMTINCISVNDYPIATIVPSDNE